MSEIAAKTAGGRSVTLRFTAEEHQSRIAHARAEMKRRGLAALLVFAQESHYYLTGFDTAGYVFFQVGVITADEKPTVLLTRRPDLRQAEVSSLYDDIRIWLNTEGVRPALELRGILEELGCEGAKVGVEFATYGLTGANCREVESALNGFCALEDASDLVRNLRLMKSSAELVYVREAGKLADAAVHAMVGATRPGALDSEATAAGIAAMLAAGGDMPAGGPLVNSGPRALYGRGVGGPRRLDANDQMMIELGASYCRYHVCIEHTVAIGKVDPRHEDMIKVAADALNEIVASARAGRELGTLDDIHRRVLDAAGFAKERFAACGYSLGCTFRPTWMDVPPMIYSGNPLIMQPGMVLFVHIMIPDTRTGLAAGLGQTFVITEGAAELLSDIPLELHMR
ncbi:Xaa-Pro peptidase family protein [Terrarubrum flagellatum]|uniref:M24 family metallopeptidase n=1 Tax=Terrirubrum flagellatum TaxID=2895980 RepID=UPI0031452D0B